MRAARRAAADQRFRIGRPDGKSKASLVSTSRRGSRMTGLTTSTVRSGPFGTACAGKVLDLGFPTPPFLTVALRLGLRTAPLPAVALRLDLRPTARVVRLLGFGAIANSNCAALTRAGVGLNLRPDTHAINRFGPVRGARRRSPKLPARTAPGTDWPSWDAKALCPSAESVEGQVALRVAIGLFRCKASKQA